MTPSVMPAPTGVLTGPFRRLLAAQGLSGCADRGLIVVCALQTARVPGAAAAIIASGYAAVALAAPLAGLIVDRWDRRRVLAGSEAFRAAVSGALILTATVPGLASPHLLVAVACAGVVAVNAAGQLVIPARVVVTAVLVPEPGRFRAASAAETVTASASVAGPAAAAPLVLACGVPTALAAVAACYLLSLAAVRALPPLPPGTEQTGARAALAEGLRAFRRSAVLPRLTLVTAVSQLGTGTVSALALAVVAHRLRGGAGGYGLAEALAGAGLIAGCVLAGPVTARVGARLSVAAGLLAAGTLTAVLAVQGLFIAGLTVLACYWAAIGALETATLPLLMGAAPGHCLGRALSVFRTANQASAAVAAAVAGLFVSAPVPALLAAAALLTAAGCTAAMVLGRPRSAGAPA